MAHRPPARAAASAAALVVLLAGAAAGSFAIGASGTADPPGMAGTIGARDGDLTGEDVDAIVRHGPWPVAFEPDRSNRASGRPAAVALGRRLFVDTGLSRTGTVSCASCHRPELGFTDGRARGVGIEGLDRNTPSLLDARLQHWFGWDGGSDSLWAFNVRPLLDPREMGADAVRVARRVAAEPGLACLYRKAFGAAPGAAPADRVLVDAAKALAAFVETLDSGRTVFDDFRDALARGEPPAQAASAAGYPADATRGLRLFVGRGRCNLCHLGPQFSNGEFHDIGRPFMAAPGRPDPGRLGGIRAVLADPLNLLGAHSDDASRATAVRTRHVAATHRNFGEFKVPTLRGLSRTAPYMHDGSLSTLRDVLRHYSELDVDRLHSDGEALLVPLRLTPRETDELLAFLATLSTPSTARGSVAAGSAELPGTVGAADSLGTVGAADSPGTAAGRASGEACPTGP